MKIKTSITISEEIIKEMDTLLGDSGNRSAFIERALRDYITAKNREIREAKDYEILNQKSSTLNEEAMDVLSYQVDI